MAKGRVSEIVAQPDRLDKIFIEPQRPSNCPRDLRNLQRVRKPRTVMVTLRRNKDLRLMLEPPERLRMQNTVAIALKTGAGSGLVFDNLAASIGALRSQGGQPFTLARFEPCAYRAMVRTLSRHVPLL